MEQTFIMCRPPSPLGLAVAAEEVPVLGPFWHPFWRPMCKLSKWKWVEELGKCWCVYCEVVVVAEALTVTEGPKETAVSVQGFTDRIT
jgi:hypothetical protein